MVECSEKSNPYRIYKLGLENPLLPSEKNEMLKKIKMGTREWAKKEINCIKGCHNNCLYCYAKGIAKRFKRCTEDTWCEMTLNCNAINKNYSKVKKKGSQAYDIMFPTSHDIFPMEPFYSAYLSVLKKLLRARNTVLIVSKPRVDVITNLCHEIKMHKEQVAFRFTIGSSDSNILRVFEPNAPSFNERFESLRVATDLGFRTTVSAEPLLDSDPSDLISKLCPYLSDLDYEKDAGTIWIGLLKMQYIPISKRKGEIEAHLKRIKEAQQFDNVYRYYEKFFNHERVKWKESIVKLMIENDIKVKLF